MFISVTSEMFTSVTSENFSRDVSDVSYFFHGTTHAECKNYSKLVGSILALMERQKLHLE